MTESVTHLTGSPDRPDALDGALCALRRNAHDHPGLDRGERGAAVDPERPGLHPVRPRMGHERLPDRLRGPAAPGRTAGRPRRPQVRVHDRARGVHHRIARLRHGPELRGARRRALHPGSRRRADLGRDPRHDRGDVPGAPGAGQGDRRLQLRGLRRRVHRTAGGRRAHAGHQLALDLLREPAHRRGHRVRGVPPGAARPGSRTPPRSRRARRGAGHRRADARRVHDRRRGRPRLGLRRARSGWARCRWAC